MKKISVMLVVLVMAVTMSANKFVKVTSAPEDWSGQYLLAWDAGDSVLVFNGKDEGHDYVKVTAADGVITGEYNTCVVEIAAMTGGYALKLVEQGKFMGGKTTNDNGLVFSIDPVLNTLALAEGLVTVTSNSKLFVFNSTSGANNMRFRYYKSGTASADAYKKVSFYKAETSYIPNPWTPDTISVSEAKRLIRDSVKGEDGKLLMNKSHYVKGVVSNPNFGNSWPGYAIVWMRDIDNELDTIEGYKIYKDGNSTNWASAEDIPFAYSDTVLMFADGLMHYKDATTDVDEISSGYYAKMLGKTQLIEANSIFKFGVGARQWGAAFDGVRYKYELILSKTSEEDYDNALHMIINTVAAKGIAGKYTVKNYQNDSSYVDGEGPVSGSVELGYVEEAGQVNNKYTVKADFSLNNVLYHLDTVYNLSGLDFDTYEQFKLSDDVPYVPKDGDTITCTQALQYAKTLGSNADMTNFYVRGYATGFQKINGRTQQSLYMADDAKASQGTFSAYLCYTQNLDSIVKGDYVIVRNTGKDGFTYYAKGNCAQMSKGDIYRLSGSNTQRPRNPQLEVRPEGAITVAEAMAIGEALQAQVGQTVETPEEYTVVGYIVDVNRQMDRDTATWYMHDVQGQYGDFQAYKCEIPSLICENDFVYVTGRIAKYQKSADKANIEISKGKAGFIELSSDLKQVVAAIKQSGAKKVLVGGKLFIVKEGRIYTPMGAVIR